MSAHVLLNLLKKLRQINQIRCLSSILSLFHNEFNKFNNAGARMLDSILKSCFLHENVSFFFHMHDVKSVIL